MLNTQQAEAALCQRSYATDFIQMIMYTTDVVLNIPVRCSCS